MIVEVESAATSAQVVSNTDTVLRGCSIIYSQEFDNAASSQTYRGKEGFAAEPPIPLPSRSPGAEEPKR